MKNLTTPTSYDLQHWLNPSVRPPKDAVPLPHSDYRPIHQAAIGDDATTVAAILATDPAALNLREDGGRTPLHLAAAHGCISVVRLLLEKGADLEARGKTGETPLHVAAQEGSEFVVMLLISKGAELNARDNEGRTPLRRAVEWRQGATAEVLRWATAE